MASHTNVAPKTLAVSGGINTNSLPPINVSTSLNLFSDGHTFTTDQHPATPSCQVKPGSSPGQGGTSLPALGEGSRHEPVRSPPISHRSVCELEILQSNNPWGYFSAWTCDQSLKSSVATVELSNFISSTDLPVIQLGT